MHFQFHRNAGVRGWSWVVAPQACQFRDLVTGVVKFHEILWLEIFHDLLKKFTTF